MSQYFENDDSVKSEIIKIRDRFGQFSFDFYSDNGVFSKDEVDYGTRLLIETFLKSGNKGTILDMGGGIGVISIVLSKILNCHCTMSEINKRAVDLAKKNVLLNSLDGMVEVIESNAYENIKGEFDFVITNPPIRAGKKVVYEFLLNSIDYLKDKGELWFVMRKSHGAPSAKRDVEKVFANCEIVKRDKGFYILRAIKNK